MFDVPMLILFTTACQRGKKVRRLYYPGMNRRHIKNSNVYTEK